MCAHYLNSRVHHRAARKTMQETLLTVTALLEKAGRKVSSSSSSSSSVPTSGGRRSGNSNSPGPTDGGSFSDRSIRKVFKYLDINNDDVLQPKELLLFYKRKRGLSTPEAKVGGQTQAVLLRMLVLLLLRLRGCCCGCEAAAAAATAAATATAADARLFARPSARLCTNVPHVVLPSAQVASQPNPTQPKPDPTQAATDSDVAHFDVNEDGVISMVEFQAGIKGMGSAADAWLADKVSAAAEQRGHNHGSDSGSGNGNGSGSGSGSSKRRSRRADSVDTRDRSPSPATSPSLSSAHHRPTGSSGSDDLHEEDDLLLLVPVAVHPLLAQSNATASQLDAVMAAMEEMTLGDDSTGSSSNSERTASPNDRVAAVNGSGGGAAGGGDKGELKKRVHRVFKLIDRNANGTLSRGELKRALKKVRWIVRVPVVFCLAVRRHTQ
jgi:hypothetical protein